MARVCFSQLFGQINVWHGRVGREVAKVMSNLKLGMADTDVAHGGMGAFSPRP